MTLPPLASPEDRDLEVDEPVEGTPEDQEAEYQRQLEEEAKHGHPALD